MNTMTNDWREALDRGRFDEAERLYLLSGENDPEVKRAVAALAIIQEQVRDKAWTAAHRRLERLEERPPLLDWEGLGEELSWLEKIARELERGDFEGALKLLEGRKGQWFAAEAANQRGTALSHAGEFERARESFEEALELDPRHYRALTNLGNSWLEADETDEAIDCYLRALKLNEEFANAHHNLGVAYRRKGQVGKSVRELRRAQRVRSRSEQERAREDLGGSASAGLKVLRWTLYALIALAAYVILRNQGII